MITVIFHDGICHVDGHTPHGREIGVEYCRSFTSCRGHMALAGVDVTYNLGLRVQRRGRDQCVFGTGLGLRGCDE